MYSPQQQLFDKIFMESQALGFDTYTYLPSEEVAYPFVVIGEQFDVDRVTKSGLIGDISQTVHIYHTHKRQGDLSVMVVKLRMAIYRIKRTPNFNIAVKGVTGRIITEPRDTNPLLHGVLEVQATFN